MSYAQPPYDVITSMSPHMSTSYNARRISRSYSSQTGSHSYRIEKPRSNHNSPRTVERRKTTTGAKLYATLDDHYNMMMGLTGEGAVMEDKFESAPTRPMSWHPSSTQFQVPRTSPIEQYAPQDYSRQCFDSSSNSVHGSDFYSMSARNSMYMEPPQTYPSAHRDSQDSGFSWQTQACTHSSYSTPAAEPMPLYLQEWARMNQAQVDQAETISLPLQYAAPEQELDCAGGETRDPGKELVGMGLYDLPDTFLGWGSPQAEATGKGLKLEETWQPPEEVNNDDDDVEDEDEDEENEEEDDTSSEDGDDELPSPPTKQASEQLPVPVNMKPQLPYAMEGQSFFFEGDENITNEWWYPQLYQPSLLVRDAGIGYGWL